MNLIPRLILISCLLTGLLTVGSVVQAEQEGNKFIPVTDSMLQNPDPADWLMWRRTLNSWGYSPLKQIKRRNVKKLTLAWARGLPEPRGTGVQEATPLVYNGIMYMPIRGDIIQAINAATGDLIWEYSRKLPEDLGDYLWGSGTNRNLAIYDDMIIGSSSDLAVFALDAVTGKLIWETQINDYKTHPALQTSGPIIADGKVISTRGCQPKGGPEACVITAHDAKNGQELWRTHTIQKPGEGEDTWGVPYDKRWHVGAWMVPSYDPELNLIYVGTSVTSPAPKFLLGGNTKTYLYHNSTLAIDADSGKIEWHYQHLVDHWDLDHPFERLLVDTKVAPDAKDVSWINPNLKPGERRKVLTGIPGKTGIIYTLDRETGEFLWAKETIKQNVVADINGSDGAVTVNTETVFTRAGQRKHICPSSMGGKNWQAGAYNPRSNTMYYPLQNTCMQLTSVTDKQSLDSLYGVRERESLAPGSDKLGSIYAVSAETGTTAWEYKQRAGVMSLVATGGGLIFGGDANGRFRALDERTGKVLWETNLGSLVTGYPITYSVKGRQYIAVSTGAGVITGKHLSLTPEFKPGQARNLFVFALPE